MARPVRYKVEGYSHNSFFSKYMIHTGAIIFIFLMVHFFNFYFVKLGWVSTSCRSWKGRFLSDGYPSVPQIISMPFFIWYWWSSWPSINHAFHQHPDTRLNHSKYTPAIKFIGTLYSVIVPARFCTYSCLFPFLLNNRNKAAIIIYFSSMKL